ncbi:MAG: hypothetical protein KDJ89_07610, partial [Notoacmeibacter sp.]|nr:hypothetical protein [Notoacmeibacter sp.]
AGFLFKGAIEWPDAFLIMGMVVTAASFLAFFVRFSPEQEAEEKANFVAANIETLRARADKAMKEFETGLAIIEQHKTKKAEPAE